MPRCVSRWAAKAFVGAKYFFFKGYYRRLMIQAIYLYRSSHLFQEKWEQVGLDCAHSSFSGELANHFFWKAGKEPIRIRAQIFLDFLLGRPEEVIYVIRKQ